MYAGCTPAVLAWLLTALLAGCQDNSLLTSQRLEPCRALVAAPPSAWRAHWHKVHDLGPETTPVLVRCLEEDQAGAGRQAAIHLLGEWRHPDRAADAFLQRLVKTNGPDAAAAALAIGRRQDRTAAALLVTTVKDHSVPVTTRTAAACALLDLGEPQQALPLLRAVLLAATPYGQQLEREQGLPLKTRWAVERYMVIEAIRRFTQGETFGLDEDAPWPTLRDGTAAFLQYVQTRDTKRKER